MSWLTSCTKTEDFITSNGGRFRYCDAIPIGDFHEGWREVNKGRSGAPINTTLVDQYLEAIASNLRLPPIIVYKLVGGWDVPDGKQRLAAAIKHGETHVPAYILENPSGLVLDKIQKGANAQLNGTKPELEFRIIQALQLMERHNLSAKEAAINQSVTVAQIQGYQDREKSVAILEKLGRDATGFPGVNGYLSQLKPFHGKPDVLCKVFDLTHELPQSMRDEIIEDVANQRGKGHYDAIEKWANDAAVRETLAGKHRTISGNALILQTMRATVSVLKKHASSAVLRDRKQVEDLQRYQKQINSLVSGIITRNMSVK